MWISKKQKDALNKRLNNKFDALEKRVADLEVQVQSQQSSYETFIDGNAVNISNAVVGLQLKCHRE